MTEKNILSPEDFPRRADFNTLHAADPNRAAHQLILMREAARRNLACFVAFRYFATGKDIHWNWHLTYLCDIFTAVHLRHLTRTIVNIPPRFLKSELIGQAFPAWMIGREDNSRSSVLSASATAQLAGRDSRKTLEIIKSDWYRSLFPAVELAKEAEVEWETKGGATRNAAGAEGTITGRGGDHLIWDDVLLAKDAMSELVREKTNEWLGETFRNRLNDQATGTITGIQQRLHELDPTGYLLKSQRTVGADQYTHIVLPNEAPHRTVVQFKGKVYATREAGDLLHPARVGPTETAALKAAMRVNYEGQYNQNPIKMEGGHLDPRRIQRLTGNGLELKTRLGLTPIFYIDFAGTEKKSLKDDPDFNVIHVLARDELRRLIHLDIWRKQTADYGEMARTLIFMHKLWRPQMVKGEKGSMLNLFQPSLQREMRAIGHFLTLEPLPARKIDKIGRSMSYQGELNAGMICAPEDAPWFAAFEAEARAFPNGAHDDTLEGGFDAAMDIMPIGNSPVVSPTDPQVQLSDEIKRRIAQAKDRLTNPPLANGEYW
jgi:predicted phage terminase large subunit-like protein